MGDKATKAFRQRRDSSMRVAARLVHEGKADGMISAGNTGAVMATAKIVLGALEGVDRPAIAQAFPTSKGTAAVLLDVGANVDCKPHHLLEFAVMGQTYYRVIFGVEQPRIGLLSIGQEEHKGNELTREAMVLLKQLPLNFIGNVEGRDLYNGRADVVVCDGFIGNVALKASEGAIQVVSSMLKEALVQHPLFQGWLRAGSQSFPKFQEACGLFRVWWRPPAGREGRVHHLPRRVELQGHKERHPCGGGIFCRQSERENRTRISGCPPGDILKGSQGSPASVPRSHR